MKFHPNGPVGTMTVVGTCCILPLAKSSSLALTVVIHYLELISLVSHNA